MESTLSMTEPYQEGIKTLPKGNEIRTSRRKEYFHCKVLPRIKHFLWRACVNSLPTRSNLQHRRIIDDGVCGLCGQEIDSVDHLILRCNNVIGIWKCGPIRLDMNKFNGWALKHVVWELMEKLPREAFNLFANLMYSIWKGRNKFYFENMEFQHQKVLFWAQQIWGEMEDNLEKQGERQTRLNSTQNWEPPPENTLAMDCDVAELRNGNIGLGIIFRNEFGAAVFACKNEIVIAGSTTLLEGLAMRYGLSMAVAHNLCRLHVHGDNLTLIKGLNGEIEMEPYCKLVKEDILKIAAEAQVLSFKFIPRTCNRVAHLLARGPNFLGLNSIPENVLAVVRTESVHDQYKFCYFLKKKISFYNNSFLEIETDGGSIVF